MMMMMMTQNKLRECVCVCVYVKIGQRVPRRRSKTASTTVWPQSLICFLNLIKDDDNDHIKQAYKDTTRM